MHLVMLCCCGDLTFDPSAVMLCQTPRVALQRSYKYSQLKMQVEGGGQRRKERSKKKEKKKKKKNRWLDETQAWTGHVTGGVPWNFLLALPLCRSSWCHYSHRLREFETPALPASNPSRAEPSMKVTSSIISTARSALFNPSIAMMDLRGDAVSSAAAEWSRIYSQSRRSTLKQRGSD
ncbi:hypothetical protein INR49_002701 [Caranx melampygus]|nr:hypothetical protein INR49_002701 [Caranx melampygus]